MRKHFRYKKSTSRARGMRARRVLQRKENEAIALAETAALEVQVPSTSTQVTLIPPKSAESTPVRTVSTQTKPSRPAPRKKARQHYHKVFSEPFTIDKDSNRQIVSEACIMEIANASARHAVTCSGCSFKSVTFVNGKVELDCDNCLKIIVVPQDLGMRFPVKKALALSVFASGTGLEAVNTVLTTLQLPELTYYYFDHYEEVLFCELDQALHEECDTNAEMEGRLALEAGDFVEVNGQKVPFITVVVDGGWSKRAYGHKYDSKSGVAVIIGARTKKILDMNIKNKTCSKCDRAKKNGKSAGPHRCFKNWSDSPQAMEAAIIVDGFRLSYERHGLFYKYVVGDADSSVYFSIKNQIHYPGGVEIQKIDCVNHALRGINSKLFGLTKNTLLPLGDRDLIGKKLEQFGRDIKGAIESNYKLKVDNNQPNAAKSLFDDIMNIPKHVLGDHRRCKVTYCKNQGQCEMEPISPKGFEMISTAFNLLAKRSDRLIYNVTSNLAEGFMSQMSRYCSGKRCNQNQRYGYSIRAHAAAFAFDNDRFWPAAVYKKYQSISNQVWDSKSAQSVLRKQQSVKSVRTRFRKQKKTSRKAADTFYGEDAQDADVSSEVMIAGVEELARNLQVTREQRDSIERDTVGQSFCDEWKYQRSKRLTASNAGKVFKMRDTTKSANLVRSIVYPVDLSNNEHVRRGINFEPYAKQKYMEETGNFVEDCGLFIYLNNGVLAASPDGLIEDVGIIEIKCTSVSPNDLAGRKDKILVLDKDSGKVRLNKDHCYYFQAIAQLYIAVKLYCDFVIYYKDKDTNEETIFIQRIEKTAETDLIWDKMEAKLVRFYMHDLAPELFAPRLSKFPRQPIREPAYRDLARNLAVKRKAQAALKPKRLRKKVKLTSASVDLDLQSSDS